MDQLFFHEDVFSMGKSFSREGLPSAADRLVGAKRIVDQSVADLEWPDLVGARLNESGEGADTLRSGGSAGGQPVQDRTEARELHAISVFLTRATGTTALASRMGDAWRAGCGMDVRRGIGVNMHRITSGTAASLRISVERVTGFRHLAWRASPIGDARRRSGRSARGRRR